MEAIDAAAADAAVVPEPIGLDPDSKRVPFGPGYWVQSHRRDAFWLEVGKGRGGLGIGHTSKA